MSFQSFINGQPAGGFGGSTTFSGQPIWGANPFSDYYAPPPREVSLQVVIDGEQLEIVMPEPQWERLVTDARARKARQNPSPKPASPVELPRTVAEALAALRDITGDSVTDPRALLRRAKRIAHPDTGGSNDQFLRVTTAETILRRHGHL